MEMQRAVCAELVVTIGLDGETWLSVKVVTCKRKKSLTSTMSVEVFQILSGKHDWKSVLDTAKCRCIVVSRYECGPPFTFPHVFRRWRKGLSTGIDVSWLNGTVDFLGSMLGVCNDIP